METKYLKKFLKSIIIKRSRELFLLFVFRVRSGSY